MSVGDGPRSRQLSSWKEIAAHFGRDVRTVQRWEKEGLPVHRHPHKARNSVYAFTGELDTWWGGHAAIASAEPDLPQSALDPRPAEASIVEPRVVSRRWPPAAVVGGALLLVATAASLSPFARRDLDGPPPRAL